MSVTETLAIAVHAGQAERRPSAATEAPEGTADTEAAPGGAETSVRRTAGTAADSMTSASTAPRPRRQWSSACSGPAGTRRFFEELERFTSVVTEGMADGAARPR